MVRLTHAALLAVLLALPMACSARGNVPDGGMCQTVPWGGFNGTPECQGIAAQVIQAQHRVCQQDSDCAVIASSACQAHAVHAQAVPIYSGFPPPCNHPLAGMCLPVTWRAVCQQGCCAPSSAAPPPVY